MKEKEMTQKQDHPCDLCHMGWANQDENGAIDSCWQTCNNISDWILEETLVKYKGVWEQLARM